MGAEDSKKSLSSYHEELAQHLTTRNITFEGHSFARAEQHFLRASPEPNILVKSSYKPTSSSMVEELNRSETPRAATEVAFFFV